MVKSLSELSEKLKHPSDIDNKIEAIISSCRNNIEVQESKTIALFNSQLYSISQISDKIKNTGKVASRIKEMKLEGLNIIQNSESALKDYGSIRSVVYAHKNFVATKNFIKNLESVEDPIDEEDLEKYHKIVYKKEEFLYDLIWYKNNLNEDDLKRIELKIDALKKTIMEFTTILFKIMGDFATYAPYFQKISNIVAIEEKRDHVTIKAKEGESNNDIVSRQYYLENLKYTKRDVKGLKDKLINVIQSSIRNKFESLKKDKEYILKMDNIFEDYQKISQYQLSFYSLNDFLRYYHACLKDFILFKLKEIEPEDILGIIEFKATYYETLKKDYEKDSEKIGKALIDNEPELLEKYAQAVTIKLKSWIDNITNAEIERFKIRESSINRDEEGKLISPGFINLMQIIKAQLEPVKYHKKVFGSVLKVLKEKCNGFKDAIAATMHKEFKLSAENKGLPGFEDYCIMFGNSGLKLTQYFGTLDFFQGNDSRELQSIFLEILKISNGLMCNFVIQTCLPVISKVFTDEWVEKNLSQVFVVTLDDFLQDYVKTLAAYAFTTFVCDLCRKIYTCYKIQLKSAKIVLNTKTGRYLKKDYEKLINLFSKFLPEEDFIDNIKPIIKLLPLVDENSGEVFIVEARSIILSDSSIDKAMILNILDKKSEMGSQDKNYIVQHMNELFISDKRKRGPF